MAKHFTDFSMCGEEADLEFLSAGESPLKEAKLIPRNSQQPNELWNPKVPYKEVYCLSEFDRCWENLIVIDHEMKYLPIPEEPGELSMNAGSLPESILSVCNTAIDDFMRNLHNLGMTIKEYALVTRDDTLKDIQRLSARSKHMENLGRRANQKGQKTHTDN